MYHVSVLRTCSKPQIGQTKQGKSGSPPHLCWLARCLPLPGREAPPANSAAAQVRLAFWERAPIPARAVCACQIPVAMQPLKLSTNHCPSMATMRRPGVFANFPSLLVFCARSLRNWTSRCQGLVQFHAFSPAAVQRDVLLDWLEGAGHQGRRLILFPSSSDNTQAKVTIKTPLDDEQFLFAPLHLTFTNKIRILPAPLATSFFTRILLNTATLIHTTLPSAPRRLIVHRAFSFSPIPTESTSRCAVPSSLRPRSLQVSHLLKTWVI